MSLLEPDEQPKASGAPQVISIFDDGEGKGDEDPFILSETKLMSVDETIRSSGMAYSAAVALGASVVFMLLLGWGADLLLGSSPWGVVVGILIGAAIGFYQFFRVTSQIFKK